jgi:hypothetical protein
MISHDAFRMLAAWAIDQPLAGDEERQQAIHRAGCDACRAFDDGLRADAVAVGQRRQLVPSGSLDRRIEAAILGARPMGRLSPVALLLVMAIMLVAAASAVIVAGSFLNREQVRLPDRPAVPEGWRSVVASSRDLRITIPPYLGVQTVDGTVMASEAPVGNANFLSLMASGPAFTAQPRAGQSLESWLKEIVSRSPHGPYRTRPISLPTGLGVELRVLVGAGTPDVTQVALYGISTLDGVSLLWLSGRPEDFVNHAADLELIPRLLETGPALTAILPPEPPGFELRLSTPEGWGQMAAPAQPADGLDWSTFVSNAAFPPDLCLPAADGTLYCNPVVRDGATPGTFLMGVIDVRGGVTHFPVDAPSLPPAVHHATVGGHAAIRTDHLVAHEGTVEFIWEVPSPGEPAGTFVIRMVVTADRYEAVLPLVELMLQDAEFVARK